MINMMQFIYNLLFFNNGFFVSYFTLRYMDSFSNGSRYLYPVL